MVKYELIKYEYYKNTITINGWLQATVDSDGHRDQGYQQAATQV